MKDKSLTRQQKLDAYQKINYPDSVIIPYDSIKKLQFSLTGDKKYRVQVRTSFIGYLTLDILCGVGLDLSAQNNGSGHPEVSKPGLIGLGALFIISDYLLWKANFKTIRTCDWKMKAVN